MADYSKEIGASVSSLMERDGSLMTGNSHLQARKILKKIKKKYLAAVDKGDKSEIQNTMNLVKKASQGVTQWQTIGSQVPDINNKFGWSKGMTEKDGNVIAGISSGNFELDVDEKTGDVTLEVPKIGKITSREFDEAVSKNVKPLQYISGILERSNNMFEAGSKSGDEFDYDAIYSENKMKIQADDAPSIQSLLYDEIIPGQPPIVKHIENHPDLDGYEGSVKKQVIESLAQGAHDAITVDLLAKAFTEYDKKMFQKGRAVYNEKNKSVEEGANMKPSKTVNRNMGKSFFNRVTGAVSRLIGTSNK